jgi:predicted RNase H-like HicB family nuclease
VIQTAKNWILNLINIIIFHIFKGFSAKPILKFLFSLFKRHTEMSTAAHTATFELDGAKAQIIELEYSFSRSIDPEKGQPTKVVRNGLIIMKVRSDEKELKGKIINWMGTQDKPKPGTIKIFRDHDQQQLFKQIDFDNGYVIFYRELFNSVSTGYNTDEIFHITAEKIVVKEGGSDQAKFVMKWPESDMS